MPHILLPKRILTHPLLQTGSCYIGQAVFNLMTLLPQTSGYWDSRLAQLELLIFLTFETPCYHEG